MVVTKGVPYLNKPKVKSCIFSVCRSFSYHSEADLDSATSEMKFFVTLVNASKSLTNVINSSILDVLEVLDTPLTHALNG